MLPFNMRLFALFALVLAACGANPPHSSFPRESYINALEVTVALQSADGRTFCSGVAWRDYVITAEHCVSGGHQIYLGRIDSDADPVLASVAYADPDTDLAVLLPGIGWHPRRRSEVSYEAPRVGDHVIAVGHPLGFTWSVSDGIVAVPERPADHRIPRPWMQFTAPIFPGNSGGPVLNDRDEIVGIVSFIVLDGYGGSTHTMAGAVPWRVVVEALASLQ